MLFRLLLGIMLLIFVISFLVKTLHVKRKRDHDEDNAIAFQNNELEHNQFHQQHHDSVHHNHGHTGGDSSHLGGSDGGGHPS